MSITASTTITELPLWSLLAISAVFGAVFAGAGALAHALFTRLRRGAAAGVNEVRGVAGRRAFAECLEAEWRAAGDRRRVFGLLIIDVDAFGDINHIYGRAMGDRVLVEVAERIRLRVRSDDFVARVNADEFAVICHDAGEAELVTIRRNLEAYVNFAESVPVSLSIGVAALDVHDTHPTDMIERARGSLLERRGTRPLRLVEDALTDLSTPR